MNNGPKYGFGEFTLDAERARLLRSGREVKLRPKVYDALRYFVENPGRLIRKEERRPLQGDGLLGRRAEE